MQARPPERLLSARNVTSGGLAIAALAAAGVGAFFLVQSNQEKSDAANLRNRFMLPGACLPSEPRVELPGWFLSDKVNAQFRDTNTATGLFVGAGGLAVVALVTWLAWPHAASSAPQTTGWMAPVLGGMTAGFQGSFE